MKTLRPLTVYFLALPFALCIAGSYAWFNTNIGRPASSLRSPASGIWLTARTNIPGYAFLTEPVSESVMETLGTTNILSGTFYGTQGDVHPNATPDSHSRLDAVRPLHNMSERPADARTSGHFDFDSLEPALVARQSAIDGKRATFFLATWSAKNPRPLEVLGHTPEKCWPNAGWKAIALDSRSELKLPVTFDGLLQSAQAPARKPELLFECQAFESSVTASSELAAWCILVGGKMFQNPRAPRLALSLRREMADLFAYEWRQFDLFRRMIESRISVRGTNQFVRVSVPIFKDVGMATNQLRTFASLCIEVKPTRMMTEGKR